jgi:type VI protein secretion system component Hcp
LNAGRYTAPSQNLKIDKFQIIKRLNQAFPSLRNHASENDITGNISICGTSKKQEHLKAPSAHQ